MNKAQLELLWINIQQLPIEEDLAKLKMVERKEFLKNFDK